MSERESTGVDRDGTPTLGEDPEAYAPSVAGRPALYERAGGIITPLTTTAVAFLMGGIVVLATGHNPLRTYKGIFEGAGLNWFFHFGSYLLFGADLLILYIWQARRRLRLTGAAPAAKGSA